MIDGQPEFVANGLLVHNCMMALCYGWEGIQHMILRNPTKPFGAGLDRRWNESRVFGPNFVRPRTQNERMAMALNQPKSRQFQRCPVCNKHKRCEVWMNGQHVCSQECHDRWVYRATGGRPPTGIACADSTPIPPAKIVGLDGQEW